MLGTWTTDARTSRPATLKDDGPGRDLEITYSCSFDTSDKKVARRLSMDFSFVGSYLNSSQHWPGLHAMPSQVLHITASYKFDKNETIIRATIKRPTMREIIGANQSYAHILVINLIEGEELPFRHPDETARHLFEPLHNGLVQIVSRGIITQKPQFGSNDFYCPAEFNAYRDEAIADRQAENASRQLKGV